MYCLEIAFRMTAAPRFPFLGALRRVVGVQQEPSAERATAVLCL